MERVLPAVERLAGAHPERTIYTRFIPPHQGAEARGAWRRYWERWEDLTTERLPKELLELAPPLDALARQGVVLDKSTYSPWIDGQLQSLLERRGIDTLIFSGAETDVCVLAAILGGVDRGYRVIVASDALCSSADESHDALVPLYNRRYGQQIETAITDEIIATWP